MTNSWNYDMEAAPRGKTETRVQKGPKGVDVQRDVFVPDQIIAASKCGIVTLSSWIPKEGRWRMFANGESPIAWQPWPNHPNAARDSE